MTGCRNPEFPAPKHGIGFHFPGGPIPLWSSGKPMMESVRQRNQQILQMRQDGMTRPEVAQRFGLSRSRIGAVEKEHHDEIEFGPRCGQIWQEKSAALKQHWKM
jgi:uncharacterized protein (DUF433 family)